MSELDIRSTDESQIHLIRFHSKSGEHNRPCIMTKQQHLYTLTM